MRIIEEKQNNRTNKEKIIEKNNNKKLVNAMNDIGRKWTKMLTGKIVTLIAPLLAKALVATILVIIVLGIFELFLDWLSEIAQGKNTAPTIYRALEVDNLSELIQIKGNETDGYHLEFVDDIDEKLDVVIQALKDDTDAKNIEDKSLLKKMIKAEVISEFPNLGGKVDGDDENQFQGTVNVRRVTPNKEIGELKNTGTGSAIKSNISVQTSSNGLGTKQEIPDDIKNKMVGRSMPEGATTTYDELLYLKIPYYDFNGEIQEGEMIVRKELADEVLLIFQELYNIKYPIYKMQLIDNYEGTGDTLDTNSIEDNNTSAFCYRNATGGTTISNHGLGQAIDINPLINPYVSQEGGTSVHDVSNECGYVYRDLTKWKDNTDRWSLEVAKKANIDTNTEIYKIFTKYGWTWGGDWATPKDYQHFEKTDLSSIATIAGSTDTSLKEESDGEKYIVAIAAGHNNSNNGGATYEELKEEELTIKVAEAVEQMFSIYPNIKVVQTGSTSENPGSVQISDRIRLAQEANADLCIQIHFNATGGDFCMAYYKNGDNVSQIAADVISAAIAEALGIDNMGAQPDQSGWSEYRDLSIIGHSDDTGFPNIVTEGLFIDNPEHADRIRSGEGIKSYAKGIVDGVLEYFALENKGYGQVSNITTSGGGGINSKIFNLKYVEPTIFEDLVNNNDEEAINVFTLDEDSNLVTAKWSYTTEEGIKINKNSSMNYRTQLNKFSMPFEYLLAWLIDVDDEDFISQFADLAIDSEYVIAVQDNITTIATVKTEATKQQIVVFKQMSDPNQSGYTYWQRASDTTTDWSEEEEVSRTISETCRPTIEITYADSWCANFSKESSYSSEFLSKNNYAKTLLTGKEGELIGNTIVTGYTDSVEDQGVGNVGHTASGNTPIAGRTVAMSKYAIEDLFGIQAEGNGLYGLPDEQLPKIMLNGNVYVVEDYGDSYMNNAYTQEGKLWVDVFCSNKAESYAITNMECVTPIYLAEDVKIGAYSFNNTNKEQNINTVANVSGKVKYNVSLSSENQRPTLKTSETEGELKTDVYETIRTTTTTTTLSNTYDSGKSRASGNEEKFISLYKKNEEMLRKRLKPLWLFRVLEKNSKTANLIDLTKYLIYKATKRNYGVETYDFDSIYGESQFTNANSQGQIPLHTPILSKDDFVKAMQEYSNNLSGQIKSNFDTNFLPYAAEIYDWSCEANVNPELVIVTALNEGGFDTCGGSYNYWGLNVPNGASSGNSYGSLKEGIEGYSEYIAKYEDPNKWFYQEIIKRKNERIAAGVDPLGYGDPGTLSGQQSLYSSIGKHEYGNSGAGGYYYLDPDRAGVTKIYATHAEFLAKCKDSGLPEHALGEPCTVYECGQYTAWQVENKIKSWNKIFGNYGSLSGNDGTGNQQVVELAKSKLGCPYVWGAHGPDSFDCSGLVEWVYRQIGVSVPYCTADYASYVGSQYEVSWEEAQPGDIVLILQSERTDGTGCGHAGIYIGNDEYIHAPTEGDVVKISSGAKSFFKHVFRFK